MDRRLGSADTVKLAVVADQDGVMWKGQLGRMEQVGVAERIGRIKG